MAGTRDTSSDTSDRSAATTDPASVRERGPSDSSGTSDPPPIRERRATAQVTDVQLFNERQGLEHDLAVARSTNNSEAVSAAESALSDHRGRTADNDDDVVVVGTANIDVNSSMTPRPEKLLVTPDEAAYPRAAAQAPDLVFVPDPVAHTSAVQQANQKAADESDRSTSSSSTTAK